jgi:hypothetical protein
VESVHSCAGVPSKEPTNTTNNWIPVSACNRPSAASTADRSLLSAPTVSVTCVASRAGGSALTGADHSTAARMTSRAGRARRAIDITRSP